MKTKFLLLVSIFLMALNLQAQAPEKFNYQGVARDNTGTPLANQALGLKISILNPSNTALYVETHSVSTNDFGLYHIAIGGGTPVTGTMGGVNWAGGTKKIKVEIDPNGGTNYTDLGTTQLLSVPYALYAASAPGGGGGAPTGPAGGDLSGNYPNPSIANNAVTSGKIANGTIATADLANNAVTYSKIDATGATTGQVLKFDGTDWAPAADIEGTVGSTYTAGTGIVISGNVISADLGTDIDNAELVNGAVTTGKLANDAVTYSKIDATGATTGQVLKFDGTGWAPAADIEGTTGSTYTAGTGIAISGTNQISADLGTDIATAELQNNAVVSGKINDGTIATVDLANNSVTTGKIDNGTIATADLANNSVSGAKIAGMSATNGQVLKYNGTDWAPASDNSGATYTAGTGISISGGAISADLGIDIANAELVNGAVTTGKLANEAITGVKIADMGATNGQVLTFNGIYWWPATTTSGSAGWELNGNAATATDFIGTTNTENLRFKVNNAHAGLISSSVGVANTSFGMQALNAISTGAANTAIGTRALFSNTAGNDNTAMGRSALLTNSSGNNNTAVGSFALKNNTNGLNNTAIGMRAMEENISGDQNVAMGFSALHDNTQGDDNTGIGHFVLLSNTTGMGNTAIGSAALNKNTTASYNTAIGYSAMENNTTGLGNTATGNYSLRNNTVGDFNSAHGNHALTDNTTGNHNSAHGNHALADNTTGSGNTASGSLALSSNTTGNNNTAHGKEALTSNTQGIDNTANGVYALQSNTIGNQNTAMGVGASEMNTLGDKNTVMGRSAMFHSISGNYNVAIGVNALDNAVDKNNNVAIGHKAMSPLFDPTYPAYVLGNNNVAIGSDTEVFESNGIAIGYGTGAYNGNEVKIGNSSSLHYFTFANWSVISDIRFKTNVKPQSHGLDFILKLKPIMYHYDVDKLNEATYGSERAAKLFPKDEWGKSIREKEAIWYSGFSAQQVEEAAKVIGYDFSGVHVPENDKDTYSLAYSEFVVPLVKAVQELNENNKKQQQTIDAQQAVIESLQAANKNILARLEGLEKE